jgi:hypothetical protein
MDEARRVIERLERIDRLRSGAADPAALLDELRGLLRDGEAWAVAEGVENGRTRRALSELDAALAGGEPASPRHGGGHDGRTEGGGRRG